MKVGFKLYDGYDHRETEGKRNVSAFIDEHTVPLTIQKLGSIIFSNGIYQ
jgi:hypothetical protein